MTGSVSQTGPADDPVGYMRTPTPQMRAFMEQQRASMPFTDFLEMSAEIRNIYEKYKESLEATPRGAGRAQALHRMMEGAMATASNVVVSCKVGCCGCCHGEVEVTTDEAEILRNRVAGGVEVDLDRLKAQASRERRSPEWAKFWSVENRCVFLGEGGACRIYEDRPAACRRLLVTTPPEACTTLGAAIAPVRIVLAEILLSAAVAVDDTGLASLSKRLAPLLAP